MNVGEQAEVILAMEIIQEVQGQEQADYNELLNHARARWARNNIAKPRKERPVLDVAFIVDEQDFNVKRDPIIDEPLLEGQKSEHCDFCFDDKSPSNFYEMSCCHKRFCRACLCGENGPIGLTIKEKDIKNLVCPFGPNCPEKKAGELIREQDLINLASAKDLELIKKIREKKEREDNFKKFSGFRTCKSPDCPVSYIIPQNGNGKDLEGDVICCHCKKRYCANFQIPHSAYFTCDQVKAEQERVKNLSKDDAEKESEKWEKKNTKKCPRCDNLINKDKGCKHMKCAYCNLDFCWDCLHYTSIGIGNPDGGYPHSSGFGGSYYKCPAHPELDQDPKGDHGYLHPELANNNIN